MANGTAECGAETVRDVGGFGCLVVRDRIEISGAIELECRTMPLVGSGLGNHADDGCGIAPKLGAEVVGLHIVLADGVGVWHFVTAVAQAGHVEAAVEIIRNLAGEVVCRAIDVDVIFNEPQAV